jgi:hypothetical protein
MIDVSRGAVTLILSMTAACAAAQQPEPVEFEAPPVAQNPADDPRWLGAFKTRGLFIDEGTEQGRATLEDHHIRLQAVTYEGEAERTLYPGAQLRSGEDFHLWLEAAEPVFVSVMYEDPQGEVVLLKNSGGAADFRIEPGEKTRFPREGSTIRLDNQTGTERLYIIASRLPLHELADDTSKAVDAVQETRRLPPLAPPLAKQTVSRRRRVADEKASASCQSGKQRSAFRFDCPEVKVRTHVPGLRTRGTAVEADDHSIAAMMDAEGVVVIFFPIEHVD